MDTRTYRRVQVFQAHAVRSWRARREERRKIRSSRYPRTKFTTSPPAHHTGGAPLAYGAAKGGQSPPGRCAKTNRARLLNGGGARRQAGGKPAARPGGRRALIDDRRRDHHHHGCRIARDIFRTTRAGGAARRPGCGLPRCKNIERPTIIRRYRRHHAARARAAPRGPR